MNASLHTVENAILYVLRRSETTRYSDLLRATNADSDMLKFHLRKLVDGGHVEKIALGKYRLTTVGKEYANNLDKVSCAVQKQPKLSLFLIVFRQGYNNKPEFLLQKRLRNPFYNYWGCLSGPAKWGEEFEENARAELRKQTGLSATFTVKSFLRTTDCSEDSSALLEDKLFVILESSDSIGSLSNTWSGGYNEWMTLEELKKQPHYFKNTEDVFSGLNSSAVYSSQKNSYSNTQY